jgi:hypothetical protein
LRTYIDRGVFPANRDFPGRRVPYFVDADGVHCAVAFLAAQSGERDLVDVVVEGYNNARVDEMPVEPLAAWATRNGFTVDELALIQPQYCGSCPLGWPCGDYACVSNGPGTGGSCEPFDLADGTRCRTWSVYGVEPSKCFEQVCMSGECVEARPIDCDDGDPNTADSCNEDVGCVNEPVESAQPPTPTSTPTGCSMRGRGGGDDAAAWLVIVLLALPRSRRRGGA